MTQEVMELLRGGDQLREGGREGDSKLAKPLDWSYFEPDKSEDERVHGSSPSWGEEAAGTSVIRPREQPHDLRSAEGDIQTRLPPL